MIPSSGKKEQLSIRPGSSAPSKTFPDVVITGISLCTLPGDQPFALLGAVSGNLSGVRPVAVTASRSEASEEAPILSAPISELEPMEEFGEKFSLMSEDVFAGVLQCLPEDLDGGRLLVLLLVPGKDTTRGRYLDTDAIRDRIRGISSPLGKATFRFVSDITGTEALVAGCQELSEKIWDLVLFAGIDSMCNEITYAEWMSEELILRVGASEGLVPGEAAACLLLEANSARRKSGAVYGRIGGAAVSERFADQEEDSKAASVWADTVEEALSQAERDSSKVESVILPFGEGYSHAIKWHYATRKLWPVTGPATGRCGELRPSLVLGDVGSATLPLSLALGCARFEFEHPAVSTLVACETGRSDEFGAVCLLSPR